MAGIFNTTGSSFKGVQVSGFVNYAGTGFKGMQGTGNYNVVSGSMVGAQIGGWGNWVRGNTIGTQIAGNANVNWKDFSGAQISGAVNVNGRDFIGAQISPAVNINGREMKGAQISALFNYTKKLKGFQFGLVNIADTSDGYSIGLVNIVFKGYHKLSLYATEVLPFNGAFKTGNSKLYSILLAGVSVGYGNDTMDKAWSYGYGIGREFSLSKNKKFGLNTEITAQQFYLGDFEKTNLLTRVSIHLHYKFNKFISLFAGPAVSFYYSDQLEKKDGFKLDIAPRNHFTMGDKQWKGWVGFNAGIELF